MSWREALHLLGPEDLLRQARSAGPVTGFAALAGGLPGERRGAALRTRAAQEALGLPDHLALSLEVRLAAAEQGQGSPPAEGLFDAIPFHDLAYGLLLPLAGLSPARCQRLFGLRGPATRLDGPARRELVQRFLARDDLGLTLVDKVALVRGDPFLGRPLGTSLNVLLDVLAQVVLVSPARLRQSLGASGDVQELFVQQAGRRHRSDPPLTTREVLLPLRDLRGQPVARKKQVLRALVERMGRLELFFLVGFLRQGSRISQTLGDDALVDALAAVSGAEPARLDVARSLVDVFELARLLEEEGPEGLSRLALRPLAPVAPMLAGPEVPAAPRFPLFFEKKYDGVRLMVHKAAGAGRPRLAAFTRRRLEWTEQLPGLLPLGWALPCRDCIVDGELYGLLPGEAGPRPATVYDLLQAIRGERGAPALRLRYAAFDLLYLDGRDLTGLPLLERRAALARLVGPLAGLPLPLPLELSDGELVSDRPAMLRLYELFRSQGHEGGIAKEPRGAYELGRRSDAWTKLKPALTLDLAVTGALYPTSADGPGAGFGTYLVSALGDGPALVEVGRVQGLGALDSGRLMQTILEDGLLTGRALERDTSSGRKAGVELRPGIVATVRFEGVVRDEQGTLALRDPKLLRLRTGEKDLSELDRVGTLEQLHLKQRLG